MAYAQHHYLVFRGTLGLTGSVEDMWQFGIRCLEAGVGTPSTNVSQARVDKALTALVAYFADTNAAFSTSARATEVRGIGVGENGKAMGLTRIAAAANPTNGTTSTNLHPWSVSQVITLDAGGARGGRFGRVYLPPQGISVSSAGRTNVGTAQVTAFRTFLLAALAAVGSEGAMTPVVASARYGSNRPVVSLRSGDVLDTQRRRDNRVVEKYTSLNL
jgi:hypothetical protein